MAWRGQRRIAGLLPRRPRFEPAGLTKSIQLGVKEHPALRAPCDDLPLNLLRLAVDTELTQDRLHRHWDVGFPSPKAPAAWLLASAKHVKHLAFTAPLGG